MVIAAVSNLGYASAALQHGERILWYSEVPSEVELRIVWTERSAGGEALGTSFVVLEPADGDNVVAPAGTDGAASWIDDGAGF